MTANALKAFFYLSIIICATRKIQDSINFHIIWIKKLIINLFKERGKNIKDISISPS